MELGWITVAGSVVAVLGGGFTAIKNAVDLSHLTRTRSREEYKFANEFFTDYRDANAMHPFSKEKGLQAIAGSTELSAEEIEYLVSLKGSPKALRNFVGGRRHLLPMATEGEARFKFKGLRRFWQVRFAIKSWYFIWYTVFCAIALAPLLLHITLKTASIQWEMLVLALFTFGPVAILTLRNGVRVSQAEQLVENEEVDPKALSFGKRTVGGTRGRILKAARKPRRSS
ncbi:MAG: hypothetical protein LBE30_04080 [Comamonas sp.]|nr:hypothetical protein [Comamonas sp.]